MITQQSQIKLNIPLALKEYAQSKAQRYGMPLASYIKHLILKDVEGTDYPVFQASERTIRKAKEALKNKNKAILVKDVDEFFEDL